MFKEKITADSLQEYYDKLIKLQDSHVKKFLTATMYMKIITKYVQECDSFTEFGICQGSTLAAALFTQPSRVRAYDIDLKWYDDVSNLFETFSQEHRIDFKVFEEDTSSCKVIESTDMLHVDSLHTYNHAFAELKRHAHQVKKYIVFHDTTYAPGIYKAIEEYITKHDSSWKIIERFKPAVGYTVIERNQ